MIFKTIVTAWNLGTWLHSYCRTVINCACVIEQIEQVSIHNRDTDLSIHCNLLHTIRKLWTKGEIISIINLGDCGVEIRVIFLSINLQCDIIDLTGAVILQEIEHYTLSGHVTHYITFQGWIKQFIGGHRYLIERNTEQNVVNRYSFGVVGNMCTKFGWYCSRLSRILKYFFHFFVTPLLRVLGLPYTYGVLCGL